MEGEEGGRKEEEEEEEEGPLTAGRADLGRGGMNCEASLKVERNYLMAWGGRKEKKGENMERGKSERSG